MKLCKFTAHTLSATGRQTVVVTAGTRDCLLLVGVGGTKNNSPA